MARQPKYTPPPINDDYYFILDCLDERELAIARRVRDFAEKEVGASHYRPLGPGRVPA